MFSLFPERDRITRRGVLRSMAIAALAPLVARAACPCKLTEQDDNQPNPPSTTQPATALRICSDPNNLPFSNRNGEGFEDKIAALIACNLGMSPQYTWLPQRLGFFRTALKTFDSDLVMAAPAGFDKALITIPYYRSSYVFVGRQGSQLPASFDDPILRSMKIGVQLAGSDTPPTYALAKRNLINNVTGYPVFDESSGKPAEKIIAAVAEGEIDLAIAWGPQAGFFLKRQSVPLKMSNVTPEQDVQGSVAMPFSFSICIAIRRPEAALRDRINTVLAQRRNDIDQILDQFSVPRLPLETTSSPSAKG